LALVALLLITGSLQQLLDTYARDLIAGRTDHNVPTQLTLRIVSGGLTNVLHLR
jgi:hypothetical protein